LRQVRRQAVPLAVALAAAPRRLGGLVLRGAAVGEFLGRAVLPGVVFPLRHGDQRFAFALVGDEQAQGLDPVFTAHGGENDNVPRAGPGVAFVPERLAAFDAGGQLGNLVFGAGQAGRGLGKVAVVQRHAGQDFPTGGYEDLAVEPGG
jgi:hypothetical protein